MRGFVRIAVICTLAAVAGLPGLVAAQSIPSPYRYLERRQESGPFVGYVNVDRGRFGYGPGSGTLVGGRWGVELAGPVSLEGVVGMLTGTRDVVNPGRDEGDRVVGQADQLLTTVDLRLKFSFVGDRAWHGISPFLVAGGGLAFDLAGRSAIDATLEPGDVFEFGTSFFGTLGVGNRWFVTEKFALRTDAVFSLWDIPTPPGFADPARDFPAVEENEWVRGLQITVAALLRW